jgi:hypothetical protein
VVNDGRTRCVNVTGTTTFDGQSAYVVGLKPADGSGPYAIVVSKASPLPL